jgi:hypothetical protein
MEQFFFMIHHGIHDTSRMFHAGFQAGFHADTSPMEHGDQKIYY